MYSFSGFRLDALKRQLVDPTGEPFALKSKTFDTLLYLVENRGRLIPKEELIKAVWPAIVVEENNLNQAISAIRRALGDRRDLHKFILTVPGRGYQFVADVSLVSPRRPRHIQIAIGGGLAAAAVLAAVALFAFGSRSVTDTGSQPLLLMPQTESGDARTYYLKAVDVVPDPNPGTRQESYRLFHDYLDRAIEFDENFAEAHALHALGYATELIGPRLTDAAFAEKQDLAESHAYRALDLDPEIGLAYSALARVHEANYQRAPAWQFYQLALKYSSSADANVVIDFASFSYRAGYEDDLQRYTSKLAEFDPPPNVLGVLQFLAGRYEQAIQSLYALTQVRPSVAGTYLWLAFARLAIDDEGAETDVETAYGLMTSEADARCAECNATLAYALGRVGQPDRAREIFERFRSSAKDSDVGSTIWALAYLGIGDTESALRALNEATADPNGRGYAMQFRLKHNIFLDPVLDRPEFVAARARIGFPDSNEADSIQPDSFDH